MKDSNVIISANIQAVCKKKFLVVPAIIIVLGFIVGSLIRSINYKIFTIVFFKWGVYANWFGENVFFSKGILLSSLTIIVTIVVPAIIMSVSKKNAKDSSLQLTEESLSGQQKKIFSIVKLHLLLDEIYSIKVSENIIDKIRGGKTIEIHSTSGLIKIPCVQNAMEFAAVVSAKIQA